MREGAKYSSGSLKQGVLGYSPPEVIVSLFFEIQIFTKCQYAYIH